MNSKRKSISSFLFRKKLKKLENLNQVFERLSNEIDNLTKLESGQKKNINQLSIEIKKYQNELTKLREKRFKLCKGHNWDNIKCQLEKTKNDYLKPPFKDFMNYLNG